MYAAIQFVPSGRLGKNGINAPTWHLRSDEEREHRAPVLLRHPHTSAYHHAAVVRLRRGILLVYASVMVHAANARLNVGKSVKSARLVRNGLGKGLPYQKMPLTMGSVSITNERSPLDPNHVYAKG